MNCRAGNCPICNDYCNLNTHTCSSLEDFNKSLDSAHIHLYVDKDPVVTLLDEILQQLIKLNGRI